MAIRQKPCPQCHKLALWVPSADCFFCSFCGHKFKDDILGFLKGFMK